MPLFTIITVTYNAEKFIEQSLRSVVGQTYKNYEYIIVDGGSADSTVGIIERYKQHITHFITEKDEGIYDAMNKAVDLSSGEYLFFLGADDSFYVDETLAEVATVLTERPVDLLIGKVLYTSDKIFTSRFSFDTLLNNTIHHQGTFYNRALFNNFRFDLKFRLIADYELNLRLYLRRKSLRCAYTQNFISRCTDGGVSRSQLQRAHDETNAVRRKVLGRKAILFRLLYETKFFITTRVLSK